MARQLIAERLIKIFVGSAPQPFLVQQTLLERTSPFFVKAIKNERFGGEQNIGVLKFPEDEVEVWKVLLFYIIKGELPKTIQRAADQLAEKTATVEDFQKLAALMVMCWAAGEKYFMKELQADLMDCFEEFLEMAVDNWSKSGYLSWANISLAFEISPPGSAMRRMAAQHVMRLIHGSSEGLVEQPHPEEQSKLGCLDGIPGAITDILDAREQCLSEKVAKKHKHKYGHKAPRTPR